MVYEYEFQDEKILYVTDTPDEMEQLLSQGQEVIPLLNAQNSGCSFPSCNYAVSDIENIDFDYLYKIHQRLNNIPWTILSTENLTLREMLVSDVDSFYKIYKDPAVTEFMENLFEDPEDEKLYTRNYIKDIYPFYGYGLWTILKKDTGEIIGRAGLSNRDGFDAPELGFVIKKECRKQGYAFEICSAIIQYAKKELGFNKIQALVHPNNTSSINLLKKLGFEITHTLHQGYLTARRTLS